MKFHWICVIIIAGICLLGAAAVANQSPGAPQMDLNGGERGKVPFPHLKHQETLGDCNICHSVFPQKADSIDALKAEGKLKPKEVMNKQCVKCHKDNKKEGKPTGPTTCSKCHVR